MNNAIGFYEIGDDFSVAVYDLLSPIWKCIDRFGDYCQSRIDKYLIKINGSNTSK